MLSHPDGSRALVEQDETLAALLLIGAGAGILLAVWALRERPPLRF